MKRVTSVLFLAVIAADAWAFNPFDAFEVVLRPGYVRKLKCQGRLLLSSVGNESLVQLSALPRDTGCGVLIKPIALEGQTNLILETSAGTITRKIRIEKKKDSDSDLATEMTLFPDTPAAPAQGAR
ncbi:MAG: hypothetical protein A2428_15525 [Bdellovibrionales bacterium RIFOXYC1_FULL_54_43]|nr:MAG: hypothetical protein A2428_15525 [Bdellovibrionales bacterium RIFOXYC1_FULL_54_43]OFZ84777.1 MAG: hypothetical protein A2603_05345 [Bdellovibrionales bacterium RIFOXYD1_FULL_55_31]